jgi:2-C-methyl-D-erythritol 4-phosphate cytidylyltransferase
MIDGQKVGAVIPAAGRGTRIGGVQKQFLEILGKPVLAYSLEVFEQSLLIDTITVVTNRDSMPMVEELVRAGRCPKVKHIVEGGVQRQDSVWNGLRKIQSDNIDIVAVHDAARPFVTGEIISRSVIAATQFGAAVAAIPSKDTIKITDEEQFILNTPNRDNCWIIQTPQVFKNQLLVDAFKKAYTDNYYGTDEACLVERLGIRVKIVEGSYENIKITTPEDIEIAQFFAQKRNIRQ